MKIFDFEQTPIVDIVNDILLDAVKKGASDIHFDPKEEFLQIRIRVDGILTNYATVKQEYVKNLITRIKIMSGMNITESRLPQDGAIKGRIKDNDVDLRVSSINTSRGEKIVVRILDYSLSLNGIESLGFSMTNYKKIMEMIDNPNGIILVTGATGTGKTTTVYSMLQKLNTEQTNIMSIEDPIEMDIEGINQVQVNPDIGLTFATALRSILRQDPNVIMIGEIRDSETATIAIRASITGHLVLSTLHTNDSLSTIERLMDMEVEKYLLAEALTGIISQKLARKLCPHCRKKRKTTEYEKNIIKQILNEDIDSIYEAVGCEECNNGYKGRTAIQEVLPINQDIKDALSMNVRKDKLRKLVYTSNVITLLQDGMIKVVNGDTTIEELLKLIELDTDTNNKTSLKNAIKDSILTKDNNDIIKENISTRKKTNNTKTDNNEKKESSKSKSESESNNDTQNIENEQSKKESNKKLKDVKDNNNGKKDYIDDNNENKQQKTKISNKSVKEKKIEEAKNNLSKLKDNTDSKLKEILTENENANNKNSSTNKLELINNAKSKNNKEEQIDTKDNKNLKEVKDNNDIKKNNIDDNNKNEQQNSKVTNKTAKEKKIEEKKKNLSKLKNNLDNKLKEILTVKKIDEKNEKKQESNSKENSFNQQIKAKNKDDFLDNSDDDLYIKF